MGNRNEPKPRRLGTRTDNNLNRTWIQLMGPFTTSLIHIKNIKFRQEMTEEGYIVRIGCVCFWVCIPRDNFFGGSQDCNNSEVARR